MKLLKEYAEKILYETILPVMMLTKTDFETFQDEPIEYIRN